MTQERWKRIEAIYVEAQDLAGGDREAFIRVATGGDADLEAEVRSLLEHEGGVGDVVRRAIESLGRDVLDPDNADAGLRIGPYELVREIGRGGMGVLYLARRSDSEYLQNVAVKLVRRGIDTDLILSRFRRERQILADLTHPNIATILDGGSTDDGRPYIVMEYIEGEPISVYIERNQLSLEKRLELFRSVCAAVEYAHQKLVLHRDLKPGNVLVNRQGVPKLLDFGVAKLLAPESGADDFPVTDIGQRPITPDYASPEQVRGEALGTTADVYSLGVLLYELVTGDRPFRFSQANLMEIDRIVSSEEPKRPSDAAGLPREWSKKLAGDLDNIILRAMSKEPERRYGSVGQFSDDLDRFLRGLPVSARKDTLRYRASKFIKRHKAVCVTSVIVAISLLAGVLTTSWQARRADRRFRELRRFANSVLFDLNDKFQNLPGSTAARAELVKTALSYLDSLAKESGGDPEILGELARAYERIGEIQGSPYRPNLGLVAEALESYRKAASIGEALVAQHPGNNAERRALIELRLRIALHLNNLGSAAKALDYCQQALSAARHNGDNPTDNADRLLMARSRSCMGDMYRTGRDPRNAMQNYQAAVAIYETLPQQVEEIRMLHGASLLRLGNAYMESGQLEDAAKYFQGSAAIREELAKQHPESLVYRRNLFVVNISLGNLLDGPHSISLGDNKGAKRHYGRALEIALELANADKKNAQAQADLGFAYAKMGEIRKALEPAEAVDWFRKAIAVTEALLASSKANTAAERALASRYEDLALALMGIGRKQEAIDKFQHANQILKRLTAEDVERVENHHDLMRNHCLLASAFLDTGRVSDAATQKELAMPYVRRLEVNRASLFVLRDVAGCYETFGLLALRVSSTKEAREELGKSLDLWREWNSRRPGDAAGSIRYSQVRKELEQLQSPGRISPAGR